MTAPTPFETYVDRGMELAARYATAAIEFNLCIRPEQRAEPSALLESARAALEAHLRNVPMGEASMFVVHRRPNDPHFTLYLEGATAAELAQYASAGATVVPLYRHPKDSK